MNLNEIVKLNEAWRKEPSSYQDLEDDNSRTKMYEIRKTRLTLKQIKKMRLLNDIRNAEHKEKLEFIRKMYEPPAQPA